MRDFSNMRVWLARLLIGIVFIINVMCAVQFIVCPSNFVGAYQVEGASSEAVIRSIGICFLMWNVTYPPVIFRPQLYRLLFKVILVQQIIGLIGESLLLLSLDSHLEILAASLARFIVFDSSNYVLLVLAFGLSHPHRLATNNEKIT